MSSRETIIGRLRNAPVSHTDIPTPVYTPWNSSEHSELLQRFCNALEASHAEIIKTNPDHVGTDIQDWLDTNQVSKVAIGKKVSSGQKSYIFSELERGLCKNTVVVFDQPFEHLKQELFEEVEVGITESLAGIADTGTVVLWPDANEPRTLSLVPPTHLVLVQESSIVGNFNQLMASHQWQLNLPTNVVLVSGPSKTADIQQTLAYGAHGPSRLVVFLIKDK